MPITLNGDGAISGLTATGISAVQNVGSANLPAGTVLQAVNVVNSTAIAITTQTYTNTNLTATITPKFASSKILTIVNLVGCKKEGGNNYLQAQITRDGTSILEFEREGGFDNTTGINNFGGTGTSYIDSPNTTSAVVYRVQIRLGSAAGGNVSISNTSGQSSITLMEIAA
jgi:hypothetical protein